MGNVKTQIKILWNATRTVTQYGISIHKCYLKPILEGKNASLLKCAWQKRQLVEN